MIVHGREIKFKLTIGAQQRIAAMCQDGDIKKLDDITKSGDVVAGIAAVVETIAALSEGHERARQYEQPEYEPHPLTVDEILTLERDEIIELQQEAWRALKIGSKQKIKAEAAKKKAEQGAQGRTS